jgi:hypothetical protein
MNYRSERKRKAMWKTDCVPSNTESIAGGASYVNA